MRPEDPDAAFVWDIVRYAERLARVVAHHDLETYLRDDVSQLAVERCIEVIGEAAGHLSDAFKAAHNEVPWRDIVGQRNIIAHGYRILEHDRLWQVATIHVPDLIEQLKPLIASPPPDPEG